MRVQWQQQYGRRTIHHGLEVFTAESGVTVEEVTAALRSLRIGGRVPDRQSKRADAALAKATSWVASRPPAGVSGRFSKSFYFDLETPATSWRFNIEGLGGTHLLSSCRPTLRPTERSRMLIAEQATKSRYWSSESAPRCEFALTARVEISGEDGIDVATSLLFEPLASSLDEQIDQYLYDGVHAGLATAGLPLHVDGIRVLITELRSTPPLAANARDDEMRSAAETLQALTTATVSTLLTGLRRSMIAAAD